MVMLVGGMAIAMAVAATNGWTALLAIGPIVLVIAFGSVRLARRDDDLGALLRGQPDERQRTRRLRIQAFVGRVTAVTAAGAYVGAVTARAALWPFAVALALALPCLALVAGWIRYREGAVEPGEGEG
ncbi:hypothetical protein [Aciditerrimonas ferrireducens]|uniref:hypothetical protein n=1 Tax=Aciditerrimonas ferrireducens TaxID=667306 RepID=UPI0020062824|nr:hypothetical protein [Aciditerrimonas ferrireducens]MCK4177767.1 hypothetical protein [Aciditerrimonas ferrireducens]